MSSTFVMDIDIHCIVSYSMGRKSHREGTYNPMHIKFNLFQLKHDLERIKGAEISWAEIARKSGVHANTLVSLNKQKARTLNLDTVEKLLEFFNAEGLNVTPCDLLSSTPKEATTEG